MSSAPSPPTAETQSSERQTQRLERVLHRLRALLEGDETEQRETFAYLQQAIDEDRTSSRKRFGSP